MFATLQQQFAARLLAQLLQHVQMLIELLGAAASSGLGDLVQPLTAMAGVVDVPAGTRDRPATIQSFQSIHYTRKIFDYGEITARQLAQHAYSIFAMVDRLEIMEAQPFGKFASVDLVTLVALFEQRDLAWITDQNVSHMRLEQVVKPGCPGAFLEGHEQAAAQSSEKLQKRGSFGFQDGFHDNFALEIHDRYRDRCLMNIQPNILFA